MTDAPPPAPEPSSTPYSSAPEQKTNTLAIVALILGILIPIAGIVVGHISLSQIKKTGENGRGLALTALLLLVRSQRLLDRQPQLETLAVTPLEFFPQRLDPLLAGPQCPRLGPQVLT